MECVFIPEASHQGPGVPPDDCSINNMSHEKLFPAAVVCLCKIAFFGISGSVYGYSQVENYDSLLTVLRDMSDDEKEQLVRKIQVQQ